MRMESDDHILTDGHLYAVYSQLILCPLSRGQHSELPTRLKRNISSLPSTHSEEASNDECAALHHSIFGFEIQPYSGTFLHPEGLVGGEQTERGLDLCHNLGINIDPTTDSIEHLGRQLQLLWKLTNSSTPVHTVQPILDALLIPWLAPVLVSIVRYGQPFYTQLAHDIWRIVVRHRAHFNIPFQFQPVDEEPLLDDPKTGLKDLARFLTTPGRSGFYLSRASITGIARNTQLPRGFGSRYQMMESLLFSAADQLQIPHLVTELQHELKTWEKIYNQFQQQTPTPFNFVSGWLERMQGTCKILQILQQATTN